MTTSLASFWKALDEIPQAGTDQLEWMSRLKGDWPFLQSFLRPTGIVVREINCPVGGADGCPRKVIVHPDGRIRAVCGNSPSLCDPLDLSRDDIIVLALDREKLAKAILTAFGAEPRTAQGASIGYYPVAAGAEIPIALLVSGPAEVQTQNRPAPPAAILIPTRNSTSPHLVEQWQADGYLVVFLCEEITGDEPLRLTTRTQPDRLLAPLIEVVGQAIRPLATGRIWILPFGTRWEALTFEFVDAERLIVRFQGQSRPFEPEHFGLKDRRTGKAQSGWALLLVMAGLAGRTPPVPTVKKRVALEKQKQLLAKKLVTLFGIEEDPFHRDRAAQCYVARFHLQDRRPKAASAKTL